MRCDDAAAFPAAGRVFRQPSPRHARTTSTVDFIAANLASDRRGSDPAKQVSLEAGVFADSSDRAEAAICS
jgi:hypothetical protein